MKCRPIYFLALCATLTLFSCQKQISLEEENNPGTNTSIVGNYDFVDFRVKGTTTVTTDAAPGEIYITLTDYTTKSNQGTAAITATTISTTNIAYTIDTTVMAYFYAGGVLEDSVETPFNLTMPPSSSSASYTPAGTDSIRVQAGLLDSPLGSGTSIPTEPSGVKYSWNGNILTMKTNFAITQNRVIDGDTFQFLYQGIQWVRLKKK